MNKDRDTLERIAALPEPRHLFVIPDWLDPFDLDRLIHERYLTCLHHQRDSEGMLLVAMGLRLTPKGEGLLRPAVSGRQLAMKASLAGVSFTAISLLILYLG